MPRDSNGNYVLPAGNPVQTDTLITSVWANTTMPDLGAAITDSLSRSGKGGMLAPIKAVDLQTSSPGYTFLNEPTTGIKRNAAGDVRVTVLGTDLMRFRDAVKKSETWNPRSSQFNTVDDIDAGEDDDPVARRIQHRRLLSAGTEPVAGQSSPGEIIVNINAEPYRMWIGDSAKNWVEVLAGLVGGQTGAVRVPVGTTAQAPAADKGNIRYDDTLGKYVGGDGSAYVDLGGNVITTQGDLIRGDASGNPERLALGAEAQSTSVSGGNVVWENRPRTVLPDVSTGTVIEFLNLPPGVNLYTLSFLDLSLSGTNHVLVQLGTVSGYVQSTYGSSSGYTNPGTTVTSSSVGFIAILNSPSAVFAGHMRIMRHGPGVALWTESHDGRVGITNPIVGGGVVGPMTEEVTRIRVTKTGADTIDAGSVTLAY